MKVTGLLLTATLMFMVSLVPLGNYIGESLAFSPSKKGVVDKAPSQAFEVKVNFENLGKADGSWSIVAMFEGDIWSWTATSNLLTLQPNAKKTLIWNGNVPENATANSIARLIVYYNESYVALDWWIHIIPQAQLTIRSSEVS